MGEIASHYKSAAIQSTFWSNPIFPYFTPPVRIDQFPLLKILGCMEHMSLKVCSPTVRKLVCTCCLFFYCCLQCQSVTCGTSLSHLWLHLLSNLYYQIKSNLARPKYNMHWSDVGSTYARLCRRTVWFSCVLRLEPCPGVCWRDGMLTWRMWDP